MHRNMEQMTNLFLVLGDSCGGSLKTGLLLSDSLGPVLVKQLEELSSGVLVESVRKLSDGGGDLETLVEDDLLALKADVFGPFDEAGKISAMLDVLA